MSQPEKEVETRQPKVGENFYIPDQSGDDEGEDEEREIDEVLEFDADAGSWNVASEGDFFDIVWSVEKSRWEEV